MPTPRQYANPAQRQAAYRERRAEARRKELETKGAPALPAISTMPGHVRWAAMIRQAAQLLQTAEEEMYAYHTQRSDSWRESERGETFLERLEALQEARTGIEELAP
jgi:hypothetical protein